MKALSPSILLVSALAFGSQAVQAQDLGPGSVAPALSVKTWYKGTPVTNLAPDKTYVVEFWATWCGPCRESIPHLTELAKKYKDVSFIGVSIWEDDKGTNIKDFVKQMGAKMDYNVGYSGNQEGMAKTWMSAAAQNGIPTAFVIKNKKVLWIGHPMGLEQPLVQIRSGKFDLAAFKTQFDKQAAETKFAMLTENKITDIKKNIQSDQLDIAKSNIADFEKEYPKEVGRLAAVKLLLLIKEDSAAADTKLEEMAAAKDMNTTQTLIMLAMDQLDTGGNTVLGDKVMRLIVDKASKGEVIPYYFGSVYALKRGDKKRAGELADRALTELPNSDMKTNESFKKACEELKKAATAGS